MNRIIRWLRIGGATVAAAVVVTTAYVGLCFLSYGSQTWEGLDLPEWFTAGFDYAIDETPLRWPILRLAGLVHLRDEHESMSEHRRIRTWLIRRGFKKGGDVHADAGWNEMHAYYASREASFFPSLLPTTRPTAEVDESHPLAFAKEWAELADRRPVRQAERRCQE